MLEALGARVVYWSRSAASTELSTLLASSDVVSLHLPFTPQTDRLIDPLRMKRGSILVNTARGGLVDPGRLLEALRSGHLAAAGLDVFVQEPPPAGDPLLALESVVCAPHLAWLTQETLERSIEAAWRNVERLRSGAPLENRVG
jgi:phosphoglycerate dehydrogenase-like enzyme